MLQVLFISKLPKKNYLLVLSLRTTTTTAPKQNPLSNDKIINMFSPVDVVSM